MTKTFLFFLSYKIAIIQSGYSKIYNSSSRSAICLLPAEGWEIFIQSDLLTSRRRLGNYHPQRSTYFPPKAGKIFIQCDLITSREGCEIFIHSDLPTSRRRLGKFHTKRSAYFPPKAVKSSSTADFLGFLGLLFILSLEEILNS